MTTLLLLFGAFAFTDVTVGQHHAAPPVSGRAAEDAEWSEVLRIAASHAHDARDRLAAMKKTSKFERTRALIGKILFLWNEKAGTYESSSPQTIERECAPPSELASVIGKKGAMVRLDVEVAVDASGCPASARIVAGVPNDKRLRDVVRRSLMKQRFLPRRVGHRYEKGVVRVECRVEVR